MEVSSIIRDISLIIASFTAVYGIHSWRKEFIGKKKIELVEEVLALFYEARDNISYMRSPVSYEGEGKIEGLSNDNPTRKWAREQANVLFKRYNECEQSFNRLFSLKYRFLINFKKATENPFHELRKILNRLSFAAKQLAYYWENLDTFPERQRDGIFKTIEKYEKIFWESPDEEDEIIKSVNKIIEDVEEVCKPIIKSLLK